MVNEILKVGISTNDEVTVGEHFGHCEKFAVYSIENKEIKEVEILKTPEHIPGAFPKFVVKNNIDVIITGGMGQRAFDLIKADGKEIILGASGNLADVIAEYLEGELESKGSTCSHHHHDENHKCEH